MSRFSQSGWASEAVPSWSLQERKKLPHGRPRSVSRHLFDWSQAHDLGKAGRNPSGQSLRWRSGLLTSVGSFISIFLGFTQTPVCVGFLFSFSS